MPAVLLDTGPLVAYCQRREVHHEWAVTQFAALRPPFLTCEAVMAEAAYLLSREGLSFEPAWEFMRRGILQLSFDLETEFESVAALMRRYADVSMDLADACLVRMSELHRACRLLTIDGDFRIYRRFGRQVIPLLAPF